MDRIRIAIRTDCGGDAGLGHMRRCLSLAQSLVKLGADLRFFIHGDPIGLKMARGNGFDADADAGPEQLVERIRLWGGTAVVTDSYDVGSSYWGAIRESGALLIAIDDLADRHLPVDMITNGLAHAPKLSYQALPHTVFLLGPEYILLREEFSRAVSRDCRKPPRRVLITVGGTNPFDLMGRIGEWVCEDLAEVSVDAVIGPFFESIASVEQWAEKYPARVHLHRDPPNIRELMLNADLAVSGGGQTTYELAACGTPAVGLCLADNQRETLKAMAGAGACLDAGEATASEIQRNVLKALHLLASNPERRMEMSRRGRALVDGLGADRLSRAILEAHYRAGKIRHAASQGRA